MGVCRGYVYRHWIVNDQGIEKSYIGQTIKEPEKRWRHGKAYLSDKNDCDSKFAKAIRKYGWDNFQHEVIGIVEAETKQQLAWDLDEWETYYIDKYDSFYNGYNSTTGGSGGMVMSEEARQKISETMNRTETKQKHKVATKAGMNKPQVRQKISESKKGEKHPLYGKRRSEETKQKIIESCPHRRQVICLETLQVFPSIGSANKWARITGGISKCCKGKLKSAGKHPQTGEPLHWMYYDEYLKLHN